MTTSDLLDQLKPLTAHLQGCGATGLYVYGSRARADARPDSDLDVFVDYDVTKRFSLFDLVKIKHHIEDGLGLEVDITTRDGLHPMLRAKIEAEAVRVY